MMKLIKLCVVLSIATTLLVGCNSHPIYTAGGYIVEDYAEVIAKPYVLSSIDTDTACQFGNTMAPLFESINLLTESERKIPSLLYLLSANCSEQTAREAELRSIRALRKGDKEEAKDARTVQKRWLKVTALRRKESFNSAMTAYSYQYETPTEACPEFSGEEDEITFLLGILTGLQAILSDAGAELSANVPRNIAPAAIRASYCINDDKWGGMPSSIRATTWLLLPDLKPEGVDPWQHLLIADEKGISFGVRIPLALHAIIAESTGNEKELVRAVNFLKHPIHQNKHYALLDSIGLSHIQAVSDRHWTQSTGERTPFSKLGTLSIQEVDDDLDGFDDFL